MVPIVFVAPKPLLVLVIVKRNIDEEVSFGWRPQRVRIFTIRNRDRVFPSFLSIVVYLP